MIKRGDWPIAVCTWSLGNDFDKLGALRRQTGLNHIHLAVSPALGANGKNYLERIRNEGFSITATMIDFEQEDYSTLESIKATGGIVPDLYWQENQKRVFDAIDITAELGVKYLTLHFGFIDIKDREKAAKLLKRVRILSDAAAKQNVQLLMETGQETAAQLRRFLKGLNHPALAVNFDPANMILYDKGNPIEAVKVLAKWIKQVHIKDAKKTKTPGTWGAEVTWSSGHVGSNEFLKALEWIGYTGALAIEREAGDDRFDDTKEAIKILTGAEK
ncbi:MAG TPA: sugar phosphate isomerase/epimerase [Planctomycetes bacterium]|nr:sugar phosphate isomerase/epimerase [Planctomycetota bacterium]HIJ70788.1 sugar phosphate isomerase/epimerase [Planctomycetota bacterium]